MTRTRKQHIIPRMLLSRFADPDGFLWVYAKSKAPRRSKPENECCERDFFEYELRGQKTDNSYETWLGEIETAAATLLDAICERREISQREANTWAIFVGALFGRTRKVRSQVSDGMKSKLREKIDDPNFIRDFQYSLLQRGDLHYASDLKLSLERWRDDMSASDSYYHVSALPNRIGILAPSLLERDWHTIEAADGGCFLISDCPVLTVECRNGAPSFGVGFGNKDAAILLPVSPRHLFVASPHHVGWRPQLDSAGIDSVNRVIVQFGHRNVYTNVESERVKALVDVEIDKMVFGQNVFVPPKR